ncbi:MAG TPA: hypothetical protein VNZ22_20630, partial [Bacillota bacterium]|nr:hypothetical protein [Bacillota bacterium]
MLAILAGMPDTCPAETTSLQAGALVLVNSQSAKYLDFQHYLQPYLDNFGVPYTVRDIRTNTVGPEVSRYALLIVGHSQLDINQLYLDSAAQANLSAAVANGTGLVNFDNDLVTVGGQARYPFVQSVFGFAYGAAAAGVTVTFPPTEPGGQMHAITARHQANEVLSLLSSMSFVNLSLPAGARAVAQSGGKPFVVVKEVGQGRAVQWASYDWMSTRVQGPLNGLDDVLWRSLVWAARKPFAMRGFPNLVTMRVDDLTGPYTWVHIANEVGFKPYLAIFISEISQADAADVSRLATSGNATAGVHSFTAGDLFYFDSRGRNWSDSRMADYYARGTRWHLDNGIPFPKSIIFHGSEVGSNAFGGLKDWGVEFVLLEAPIGTR